MTRVAHSAKQLEPGFRHAEFGHLPTLVYLSGSLGSCVGVSPQSFVRLYNKLPWPQLQPQTEDMLRERDPVSARKSPLP